MIRPRISQFFILPPFQRMGLGSKLLQAVYNHILEMPKVLEITGKNYVFVSRATTLYIELFWQSLYWYYLYECEYIIQNKLSWQCRY